jgi:hypothetical protein
MNGDHIDVDLDRHKMYMGKEGFRDFGSPREHRRKPARLLRESAMTREVGPGLSV